MLAFAFYMNFKLFQMDIKSTFLHGYIAEEIFIEQSSDFENYIFSNHVYKVNKILYGLKQAPRAWYERLSKFLLKNNFTRDSIDTTLFLKIKSK